MISYVKVMGGENMKCVECGNTKMFYEAYQVIDTIEYAEDGSLVNMDGGDSDKMWVECYECGSRKAEY